MMDDRLLKLAKREASRENINKSRNLISDMIIDKYNLTENDLSNPMTIETVLNRLININNILE